MDTLRRRLLTGAGFAGASLVLSGCAGGGAAKLEKQGSEKKEDKDKESGEEVTAVEDLMREHGVLRRVLLVYTSTAVKLRGNPSSVSPDAIEKAANLFRAFGEQYHEKKLEEAYIFPAVKQKGGPAATLADILIAQHQRGREITDYILSATQGGKLGAAAAGSLAQAMDGLVLMYRNHAAREDTVIFPAWKQTLTAAQMDEMNDKFEDIEREQFGQDGFEDAVKQITDIENTLGFADISQFTAPPPK